MAIIEYLPAEEKKAGGKKKKAAAKKAPAKAAGKKKDGEGDAAAGREEGETGRAEGDEAPLLAGADAEDAGGRAGVGVLPERRIGNAENGPSGPFSFPGPSPPGRFGLTGTGAGDMMKMNFIIRNGGRPAR